MGIPNCCGKKERWLCKILCWLQETELHYTQGCLFTTNMLDMLAGSQWFSTLDLVNRYWQVKVAESDHAKTAYITQERLIEFTVMPFSLCNAPATFQWLVNLVLADLNVSFTVKTLLCWGNHTKTTSRILVQRYTNTSVLTFAFNFPKCNFLCHFQQFLGLLSYYHIFIKNFASIARPLQHLTEGGRTFAWTTECANSFAVLKQRLTSAPI